MVPKPKRAAQEEIVGFDFNVSTVSTVTVPRLVACSPKVFKDHMGSVSSMHSS